MHKKLSVYRPQIRGIKVSSKEYNYLCSLFLEMKKTFFTDMATIESEEKKVITPKIKFKNKYKKVSPGDMDPYGPTVELDEKIFKLIKADKVTAFLDLWKTGILQVFMKRKWIPQVKISNYYLDDYPLMLEIQYLPCLLGLREIPTIQKRKEVCLFVSFLCYLLKGTGYQIIDPHSGNFGICFDRTYYFDFGSFKKTDREESQYSLVIGGLETILFSFFPKSLLSTWDMFTSRNDFSSRIPRELTYEYSKYSKKYINFHLLHSGRIAYKASKRVFKYFICDPTDLMILFFDKNDFNEERIKHLCQFD